MIESLKFSIEFPTGKKVSQDITFENGTMAISGPNGVGKSLVLEMIGYAKFGVDAVRGPADDYKKCEVELIERVKGVPYRITRKNGTQAAIYVEKLNDIAKVWEPLATGTRAVNAKVVEILGYGLPVFSVSNHIGQGDIEALSNMQPAERKRLVDTTIGLDVIDVTAEWASGEAALLRKEADVLEGLLVAPQEPTKPEGYRPVAELEPLVVELTTRKTEKDQIEGWLKHIVPCPVEPVCAVPEGAEELREKVEGYQRARSELEALQRRLDGIPEAPHPLETICAFEQELERAKAWSAYDAAMAKLPEKPHLTSERIEELMGQWASYHAWERAEEAFTRHKVQCPSCQHEFAPGTERPLPVEQPFVSQDILRGQGAAIRAWAAAPQEPECPRPASTTPAYTAAQVAAWKAAALRAEEREQLRSQIAAIVLPVDRSADYQVRLRFEADLRAYQELKGRYDTWVVEKSAKEARLVELGAAEQELASASAALAAARIYDQSLARYHADLDKYQEGVAKVAAVRHKAEQFKLAVAKLKELKVKIKTYLVPSLSKVASHLVQQMTAGQHQELTSVVVDEDFNITVDGQSLNTLNGSAKTVANLAVRIGLGQILTNRVFSVLMCDEVDAACDDERAAAIASCLQALTKSIKQVVIVSHKDIEADHYLKLAG